MPKVWNKKDTNVPPDAVYVGRPSKWGNPFSMKDYGWGEDGRDAVLELYKIYLDNNPELKEEAKKELKGKDLVCWCSPLPCHGDILLEIANGSA